MISPEKKALEIFNKMCSSVDELLPLDVRECALIAVDEILEIFEDTNGSDYRFEYWEQVKQEIEKL